MKIIDNCVSKFLADEIENIFLDQYTNWWYDSTTAGNIPEIVTDKKFYETFQFVHPIMDNGRYDSLYSPVVLKIADTIFSNLKIEILNYRRIKVNQLLKSNNINSHPPHVDDLSDNMISMVYYINETDGPTYFFNNELQLVEKIHPKKNRCVIFASNKLHASSSPILSNRRLVINFVASTTSTITF